MPFLKLPGLFQVSPEDCFRTPSAWEPVSRDEALRSITLQDADGQTVTVVGGDDPGSVPEAEEIQLVFTLAGKTALAPVSHKLGAAKVVL